MRLLIAVSFSMLVFLQSTSSFALSCQNYFSPTQTLRQRVGLLFRSLNPFPSRGGNAESSAGSSVIIKDKIQTPASLDAMKVSASVSDLAKFNIGEAGTNLVEALSKELFANGSPFENKFSIELISAILDRGVESFVRRPFRSPQHMWPDGHDVVVFEVKHIDATTSWLLAYRQKTNPFDLMIGGADMRPTFNIFFVAKDSTSVDALMFQDGKLQGASPVPTERAITEVTGLTRHTSALPVDYNYYPMRNR